MHIRVATADDAAMVARIINRAFVVEAFFKIGDRTSPDDVAGLHAGAACRRWPEVLDDGLDVGALGRGQAEFTGTLFVDVVE